MTHSRPGYFMSTRMYSTRNYNTDGYINGEGKRSHHIADGCTFIFRDGEEYFNIFGVWDWYRIPGTTVEYGTSLDPGQRALQELAFLRGRRERRTVRHGGDGSRQGDAVRPQELVLLRRRGGLPGGRHHQQHRQCRGHLDEPDACWPGR